MQNTRISFDEAKKLLISGKKLEWQKHLNHAAGEITLDTAQKRRLFEYLLTCKSNEIEEPTDSIFNGLINAWAAETDPAQTTVNIQTQRATATTWRLDKIKTYGFGGLNQFGGPCFDINVNQESWCIEGQNGSGKTSLTSAIIWALTGQVIREHAGLAKNNGERKDVFSNNGTKIGTWPPIAAYPTDENDLAKPANVFVRLVFKDNNGNKANVYRSLRCLPDGSVIPRVRMAPAIEPYANLIEAGVIMPNRLGHLGFGDKSESLSDAVKMLTGLDFLESLGQGAAKIKRGGSRFLNYAKQNRIDDLKADYTKWFNIAKGHTVTTGYDLTSLEHIEKELLDVELNTIRAQSETDAKNRMETLTDVLAPGIDIGSQQDRDKVEHAFGRIRILATAKPTDLSKMFEALATLNKAHSAGELQKLSNVLEEVTPALTTALQWHHKQESDLKLRFKAEASLWLESTSPQHCPLCENEFLTEQQIKLADELAGLKEHADAAKKSLEDACNAILTKISSSIPPIVQPKLQQLLLADIKQALLDDINNSFIKSPPFAILEGAKKLLALEIQNKWPSLQSYSPQAHQTSTTNEPKCAQVARRRIQEANQLLSLAEWWHLNRAAYWDFWKKAIGQPSTNGNEFEFPDSVLGSHLKELNRSLTSARPYDETAKAIKSAIEKEAKWKEINTHQKTRQAIADALAPLASLVIFVNAETSRSIDMLSNRIGNVLKRIHLHERLEYKDTAFVRESARKSTVNVHGTLKGDFKIDATLVANTSWIRAILWAFIYSLREEIVAALGYNPFPLIVMDDPQVTFDPRNEGLWATEIVRLTNSSDPDMAQVILTTHETSFFKTLVQINLDFSGRHGRIVSVTDELGVPHIDDDTHIQRLWTKAKKYNDDQTAHDFIIELRTFLETTLRYLLRGEGASVRGELLSNLIQHLKRLADSGEQPFCRPAIKALANRLNGETTRIKKIQDAHHRRGQGVPDAEDIYENLWEDLSKQLYEAFNIVADYRVYQGDHRQYTNNDNIIALPLKQKDEIRQLRMINTGIAAAAKTDGRAGDGLVTLNELEDCPEVFLNNHDVLRLVAQTLEPVANMGDYLIVKNTPKIENRCLVVAGHNARLLARRYSIPEDNPHTSVLTAQTIDPGGIADPILAQSKKLNAKMIVGTLFNQGKAIPASSDNNEVTAVDDSADYKKLLEGTRLFKVQGQSAEPIALDSQYLITGLEVTTQQEMKLLDGCLVIAADTTGARYFKRFRTAGKALVILESLNPDGFNPSIIASLDDSTDTRLSSLLPVNGVLFELP
jgi:hypothetical protein